jgi:hypothetical protein
MKKITKANKDDVLIFESDFKNEEHRKKLQDNITDTTGLRCVVFPYNAKLSNVIKNESKGIEE